MRQKVHVTLSKTEHMRAVIILTSTCKTWNARGGMGRQKDERTVHSVQLELLLFKTVFIKNREREIENKAILSDTCHSTWWLLCQQHITSTEISYPCSLFAYFLWLNNRHYILAGFICIHFYILWFDCKVFVGKRIVLHNWVFLKNVCSYLCDQRTFVSWKEKKKGRVYYDGKLLREGFKKESLTF